MIMKTTKTNKIKNLAAIIALAIGIINCGSSNIIEIRDKVYLNSTKFTHENTEQIDYNAIDILGNAIDKFESIYGKIDKEITIQPDEYSFYSEELKKDVSGLNYNYGNSCTLIIGIHPTSDCESIMILWHELYHCVSDEKEHGQWVYDLFDLRDEYREEGGCSEYDSTQSPLLHI